MKDSLKIDTCASESRDLDSLQAGLFYLTTHIALVPEQNRIYSKLINLWRARLLQNVSGLNWSLH
jgi:hypothetical protein